MKKLFTLMLIFASFTLFADDNSSSPEAGKKGKACKKRKMMAMKKFDKDNDGKLSEAEKQEMKAHMEKRRADMLAKFDKDGNGELSAEERKAAFAEFGPKGKKQCNKKKGGKKGGDKGGEDNAI